MALILLLSVLLRLIPSFGKSCEIQTSVEVAPKQDEHLHLASHVVGFRC